MNPEEIKELRGELDSVLYKIQVLKSKLQSIQLSKSTDLKIIIDIGNNRIDDINIKELPIREFIKHQMIMSIERQIKEQEVRLNNLKYNAKR